MDPAVIAKTTAVLRAAEVPPSADAGAMCTTPDGHEGQPAGTEGRRSHADPKETTGSGHLHSRDGNTP